MGMLLLCMENFEYRIHIKLFNLIHFKRNDKSLLVKYDSE